MENGIFTRFAQLLRKEKFIFVALACFLIALPLISFFSYPIPHAFEAMYFGRTANRVTQGITADKQYVFQQMGAIAASPDLAQAIQSGDVLNTLSTLQDEENIHKLDALVATDENGIVIARTQVVSRRGDYLFQTTAYGQKVAEGTSTVSIERGTALPLLIIAGFPVDEGGTMIGAVFGGYSIDDAYAHAFRGKYLSGSTNLVFYSKADGVVGTTFEDPNTKALLAAYFNTGSNWVAMGQSDQDTIIEGRSYFLKNISFSGLDGSAGGVMVLYPDYHPLAANNISIL